MPNILICDDDKDIVNALAIYLGDKEYEFSFAYNGKDAVDIVKKEDIHLILMDVMMPVMDGITALGEIRKISNAPVILLTAKSEDNDKIMGISKGADDYITKPFNPMEVVVRVRSALRRYMTLGAIKEGDEVYTVGGVELNNSTKTVKVDGEPVTLTRTEFEILRVLISSPGRVYSATEIYKKVWNEEPYGSEKSVAVHIRHIREKIEINPAEPRYIKMIFGQGYKMVAK